MKKNTHEDSKNNKPASKKLSLAKETLRSLTADELEQVQGGTEIHSSVYDDSHPGYC